MALAEVILVCLSEEPRTGYELAKQFDTSIGFFWRATHQQIYRELNRLRDRGHVQSREVVQVGKPNKLIYTLTGEGREHLRRWSHQPTQPTFVKDDLLVRCYAIGTMDLGALRADIMARMEFHRDRQARFEAIETKRFAGHELNVHEKGKLLGLRMGLRYERGWAEWCEEALEMLPMQADEKQSGAEIVELNEHNRS